MRACHYILIAGAFGIASTLQAQSPKPGLYEVTNHMTWQKSPFPENMQAAPGSGAPHTAKTCVTQAQIDRYNGPKPEAQGECKINNIQKNDKGMTAEITCTGNMKGTGTIDSIWIDAGHNRSKVHFTGSLQMGQNAKPVEWTIESESSYKGPDCGSVKPLESQQ